MQTKTQKKKNNTLTNPKKANQNSTNPIRVSIQTKTKLDAILKKLNLKKQGKKIKCNDLIFFALKKLNASDLTMIQQQSISNKERFEAAYRSLKSDGKSLSKDEFLGLLLDNNVSSMKQ